MKNDNPGDFTGLSTVRVNRRKTARFKKYDFFWQNIGKSEKLSLIRVKKFLKMHCKGRFLGEVSHAKFLVR